MKLIYSYLCISFIYICFAQNPYKIKLHSPVKHPITLSGSFGELRTNHFHSGLDIRSSRGMTGDSIFSITSGFISQIKVEPGGYGNSLYITHPDGLTSVYAHLKEFRSDIMELVFTHQSEASQFTIDLYPPKEKLPVASSEFIGLMGNSGKSFGPHLHFEIRDSKTDQLINPALFGIKPKDTRPPILEQLVIYQYDSLNNLINVGSKNLIRHKAGSYRLISDTIMLSNHLETKMSIKAFDRMNGSWNKNGIYSLEVFRNKQLMTNLLFDDLLFQDSDYIGYVSDPYQIRCKNSNFHMIDVVSDSLSISDLKSSKIKYSELDNYEVRVKDIEGNESVLKFFIKIQNQKTTPVPSLTQNLYTIHPDTVTMIRKDDFILHFPKNTVLCKKPIHISNISQGPEKFISIEMSETIVNEPFTIHYKLTSQDSIYLDKMHFSKCNSEGKSINLGVSMSKGWIFTELSSFGSYSIEIDSTPPKIVPEFNDTRVHTEKELSFIISDNKQPSRKSQYLNYKCYVDDELKLLNYDLKNDRIYGRPFSGLTPSDYLLKIVVIDCMNNKSNFTKMISTY